MDPNKEVVITMIGFAFLMILMVLVTWNDIRRYFFLKVYGRLRIKINCSKEEGY